MRDRLPPALRLRGCLIAVVLFVVGCSPVVNALGAPFHTHRPRTTGRGPRYAPDFFCATAAPINPPADASSTRAPAIIAISTATGNSNATERTQRTTAADVN